MKSLLAIALIGILSFSTNDNEINDLVLEELDINMVNLDYESELESLDLSTSEDIYLQNHFCDMYVNCENNFLNTIDIQIPNYKYLEEIESVDYSVN